MLMLKSAQFVDNSEQLRKVSVAFDGFKGKSMDFGRKNSQRLTNSLTKLE